jgi:hypothetical protein
MTPSQLLNDKSFASLVPVVKSHLRQRVNCDSLSSVAVALEETFALVLGGGHSRQELIRFIFFAAPIARRIALESTDVSDRVGTTDVCVADVKLWMWWIDAIDPLCARMIDLHYFAGLSTRETAAALKMPPRAVIRELRFAKSWLKLKLPESDSPPEE